MPYSAEHKARTRARIVEAARRLFTRHGFEQVSIDQIMARAGLTRGGFYHHFESKEQLYAASVSSYADCNPLSTKMAKGEVRVREPAALARTLIELYLSDEILDDVELQCPLYALPSDVQRAGTPTRDAYTVLLQRMEKLFRAALGDSRDAERRAQAILALCVGGMVLARTTNDPKLRRSLRAASREQAMRLLDG